MITCPDATLVIQWQCRQQIFGIVIPILHRSGPEFVTYRQPILCPHNVGPTRLLVIQRSKYTSSSHWVPCKATLTKVCIEEGIMYRDVKLTSKSLVCLLRSHLLIPFVHLLHSCYFSDKDLKTNQTHNTSFVLFMSRISIPKVRWQNQPYFCKLNNWTWGITLP